MKRCPECTKDYLDDSLLYCLDDGTPLVQGSVTGEPATVILSSGAAPGEARTMALNADGTAEPTANLTAMISMLLPGSRLRWIAAVVVIAVIAGIAGWSLRRVPTSKTPRMVMNLAMPKHLPLSWAGTIGSVVELSPDGSALLVRAQGGLYVRNFDSMDFYKVPGTEEAGNQPSWKDPSVISFSTDNNELASVRLPDGPPEVNSNFGSRGFTRGRSWSDKGTLLLSMYSQLETIGKDGMPLVIENPTKRQGRLMSPMFIPGSEDFLLYFRESGAVTGEVWLATLTEGKITNVSVLLKNETAARYTPAGGGHILFVRNDNLYSQKLDLSTRALVGDPELVAKGVASQPSGSIGKADFSVSRNGVIAWRSGRAGTSQTNVFDRTGKPVGIAGPAGAVSTIRVSPADSTRILNDGNSDSSSYVAEVGQDKKLELDDNVDWLDWTKDGEKLYGVRGEELVTHHVDGGAESVIGRLPWKSRFLIMDVSFDGRNLLLTCGRVGPICASNLSDDGVYSEPVQITSSKDPHFDGSFSPDGRSIVFTLRDGGVFAQPFPGPGRRVEISPEGKDPVWRHDGKEILFVKDNSSVWSVAVSGSSEAPSFGAPQKLFDGLIRASSAVTRSTGLGVSSDGSRIYWPQGVELPDDNLINVMFGFFTDR